MSLQTRAANALWAGASLRAWRRYRGALRTPQQTQEALLLGYLRKNCDTEIGRELAFGRIVARASRGCQAGELTALYQAQVPLTGYDELEPWVRKIRDGRRHVLTADAVRRLTPSSGSTSAAKLLPFTVELQREFSRAVDAWVAALFLCTPALLTGRAYWSISPALPTDYTGAVPVGFADDSEYLGGVRGALARAVLAVPDAVSRITEPEAFRYVTLLFLVRARDLRLISIWHPSFFSRLFQALPDWMQRIADDIGAGTLSAAAPIAPDVRAVLESRLYPDIARATELRRLSTIEPRTVWPNLTLFSCWQDGACGSYADELHRTMPGVTLQPKGLVATEGIVSIPFENRHPVAVQSHFFEFLDGSGNARGVQELQTGAEYQVVLTTGGGLYRYRLGDRVVVDGWVDSTPSLRFVGKDDRVSDRFGEKLSDGFVAGVLRVVLDGQPVPRFAMLAPDCDPAGFAYTLFLESERATPELAVILERELRRNPHYAWCVDLEQLKPARVALVGPNADRTYVDTCVARGQRPGDVKPAALHCDTGWRERFESRSSGSASLRSGAAGTGHQVRHRGGEISDSTGATVAFERDDD
jgi:hypothetical protein